MIKPLRYKVLGYLYGVPITRVYRTKLCAINLALELMHPDVRDIVLNVPVLPSLDELDELLKIGRLKTNREMRI
mgnify:CR=1 FL=1